MMDLLGDSVKVYAIIVSLIGATLGIRKWKENFKLRHLTRAWGFKNGDDILVVCSELDDGESRQAVEPNEFIYLLKYGDIDALVDVVATLLRLYPRSNLQVMSAKEAHLVNLDLTRHLVVVGGPDYNQVVKQFIDSGNSRVRYDEVNSGIVLVMSNIDQPLCAEGPYRDIGYIESFPNPYNQSSRVVVIGGCHTLGVTAAAKAIGLFTKGRSDVSDTVLLNASLLSAKPPATFVALVRAERIGATIVTPRIRTEDVFRKSQGHPLFVGSVKARDIHCSSEGSRQ